tara:strand:- start:549 stop:662 length:114 start_codon:yes stop_codon:yes gene_type:complete
VGGIPALWLQNENTRQIFVFLEAIKGGSDLISHFVLL